MHKHLTSEQINALWNKYGLDPANELLHWEKWVQIRKDEILNLAKQTRRPPVDLVMNLLENTREEREWKTVLEHAQIEKKLGIRGSLWEHAPRLPHYCDCNRDCDCCPVFEIVRTAAEIGRPRVIEHIAVPQDLRVCEKGLLGSAERKTEFKLDDEFKKYRQKREAELKVKIKKVDPCKPEMRDLIVKGKGYTKPKPLVPALPLISVSQHINNNDVITSVYALRINNSLIIKEIPGQDMSYLHSLKNKLFNDPCTTWSYYFNIPVNKVGRNKIYLENYGTVTLRYFFKKIKRPIPFISENMHDSVFFFNKNEDVLFPGQSRQIILSFISDQPGVFEEHWEIHTCNVHFFNNHLEKLGINLHGDSTEDFKEIQNKVEEFKDDISKIGIEYIIREILFDPIEKACVPEPLTYPYAKMLQESDMFLLMNPVCYYHQTEVEKLKTTYLEIPQLEEWNLAISMWRSKIINEPFENRMRLYKILKTSFAELLKPWHEENDLALQKHQAVRMLLGNLADEIDKEYFRIWFSHYHHTSVDRDDSKGSIGSILEAVPSLVTKRLNVTIHNMFTMYAHIHVVNFVEQCAGVLSSLDLNRNVQFKYCLLN